MTLNDVLAAACTVVLIVCTVAIIVGETYHRYRKRRWKKRVFHEQQVQVAMLPASHDEAN